MFRSYGRALLGILMATTMLWSCQSESNTSPEVNKSNTEQAQGAEQTEGSEFALDLTAATELDDTLSTKEITKSLNFLLADNPGKTYPKVKLHLVSSSTDSASVPVLCLFRNDATSTTHIRTLQWTYKNDTLKFKGSVNLPEAQFTPNNTGWKLFFIVGGTYNEQTKSISFAQTTLTRTNKKGDALPLDAIYMNKKGTDASASWCPLSVGSNGQITATKKIVLSPQGIIFLASARNDLSVAVPLQGVRVVSNQLSYSGKYERLDQLTSSQYPTFTPASSSNQTDYYTEANPKSVQPGQYSDYYVFVAMPKAGATSPATYMSPLFAGRKDFDVSPYEGNGVLAESQLTAGYFYNFKSLAMKLPKILPIEAAMSMISPKNQVQTYESEENSGGNGGTNDKWWSSDLQNSNRLTEEQYNKATDRTGRIHRLAFFEQWAVLIPGYAPGTETALVKIGSGSKYTNVAERLAPFGNVGDYTADYNNKSGNVTYALRLRGGDNRYFSAYRYEKFTENGTTKLRITQRILGPSRLNTTIDEISNENWWRKELEPGQKQAERILPANGYWVMADPVHGIGWVKDFKPMAKVFRGNRTNEVYLVANRNELEATTIRNFKNGKFTPLTKQEEI